MYQMVVSDGRGNLSRYPAEILFRNHAGVMVKVEVHPAEIQVQNHDGVIIEVEVPAVTVRRMMDHSLKGWFSGNSHRRKPDCYMEWHP